MARTYVWLSAVLFLGVGVGFALAPGVFAPWVELDVSGAVGRTDVRAVYGGLDLAIGAVLVWTAATDQVRTGVVVSTVGVGGLALGRTIGLALDGVTTANIGFLAMELAFFLVGAVLLVRWSPE